MENIQKKLSKADLLAALKKDINAADTLRMNAVKDVERWRQEYNGEPYGNEQKGKSQIISRDIKRQDEWQHASIKDPFVSSSDIIKCSPVTASDRPAAEQNQTVLNYQFTRKFPRYRFLTDVIKLYYSEGTVITKCGWKYEDKKEKVSAPIYAYDPSVGDIAITGYTEYEKITKIVNQPDATICKIEDTYIDPTCYGDLEKANFVCHRFESDFTTLKKSGKYKNLNKLAKNLLSSDSDASFDPEDETEFKFSDIARKKVLVYEYWGFFDVDGSGIAKPIVASWVGDVLIQLQDNPMPSKELPFILLKNNSTPFKIHGEASVELISDNQKVTTAIKRGILDNMAASNNSQKGVPVGSLTGRNLQRYLSGKSFEYQGPKDGFYEGSYNAIPSGVFNVLEMVNNETESMLGVKAFSGGISGQTLGSTATSARGALDAVSVRRSDIVRNIAENLIKPLMRKWMQYNAEFLDEEDVTRITEKEYIPPQPDDLMGLIDIEIEVSTAEDNSAKGQELSFLLQTLGQNMDFEMQKMIMIQIAKLHKMPDLATKIENYQPQPDPMAQKERELILAKLESEILERQSRTRENSVDVVVKTEQAKLHRAKSELLGSDRDLKDLEFTSIAEGKKHNEEMSKLDHNRNTKILEKQAVKAFGPRV